MARVILALVGVLLLAVTALALIWVLGQLLVGVGVVVVGTAGVLSRLLWFLVFTGLLSGLVYFVASAWRPATPGAPGGGRRRGVSSAPVPPVRVSGPVAPQESPPAPAEG
ncbi:hypothetical protein [Deinococcus koreensis]|uniref:hypothetical protein n=1 Tax=Deinococcus koreensis TaxID=2054903 RepID=UPI001A9D7A30|nr:hypothetical protein [Deinococcus koreensis]